MKIKTVLEQHGYSAVMGACLVCSAVLLFSVATDRPLVPVAQPHMPVLRVEQAETGTAAVSEETPLEPAAQTEETAQETETVNENPLQDVLAGTGGGYLLTEAFLEKNLAAALPADFPAEDLDVSLDDGLISLSFDISRAGLKAYFKERGIELGTRRNLLLQMLPRQVELEAVFAVSADENGLHLSPVHLAAGDRSIPLTGLPQDAFSPVDQAINALLSGAGVRFSSAEFTGEGLLLK